MAAKRDYYQVLGVGREAAQDEIKKAFRKMARQYHPDVNDAPDAADKFKEINEAYSVLSDPKKRAAYDRFGHAGVNGGASGGVPYTDFADIFSEIFGAGFGMGGTSTRRARSPRRGQDLQYQLTISFEEAVFGLERDIEFERTAVCDHCGGNGSEPGTAPVRCPTCRGTGEVRTVRQTFLGQMVNITTCPDCRGTGEQILDPCHVCAGRGTVRKTRHLTVSIPAGVDQGTQIRYTGEGEPGANGGPPGNLYVVIGVKPHEYFRRRNNDLQITLRLNIAQAALGHTADVPTLTRHGEVSSELAIPAGTQPGDVFTLKGKGVPKLRRDGTATGYGDLHVMVEVDVPKRLTAEQRHLFEQLAETLEDVVIPPANQKGFFERVIDWLGGE
ncbi:MAG: molecular chaperone DnaJ [Chloroflexi bacterium]|nr:molecular chaperone DnaJ [Chloroflexota bacterium]